ncbi:MAG TPA: hypothetical protein VF534_27210 [Paraburkholderia sp.]
MKFYFIVLCVILQCVVWPIWLGSRMRSGMASICYIATAIAFWLGWIAK